MDPRYKTPDAPVEDQVTLAGFRDLERFTAVLRWMLILGSVMAVIGVVSAVMQMELLSRTFDATEGAVNDRRELMYGGAAAFVILATMFVFGRWIVLAHRNLDALGASYLEFRPGWALGWFFIPIANLWKPYQAMRSLWQSSHDIHRPESQDTTWVLPIWWALWIVSTIVSNGLTNYSRHASTVTEWQSITAMEILVRACNLGLCLVAALMVTRIWKAQFAQAQNPIAAPTGFADQPAV